MSSKPIEGPGRHEPPASPTRKKMVGWFDPGQLVRTGIQVLVSNLLGARADYRLLESLGPTSEIFDYSADEEIWLDYVADLGDGWNGTYAIASLLARPGLDLPGATGAAPLTTRRGAILVMGGDEVYPAASPQGYREGTLAAYQAAMRRSEAPNPSLFAIPGNHDWYDGLVSFSRLFCQAAAGRGRWFGGWKTRQSRSYFALQLPHRWWFWGVDTQLESDIDAYQLEYFCSVAKNLQKGDRVIVATAEPHWIYGNIYDPDLHHNLAHLEKFVIRNAGGVAKLILAGDIHHYRRHRPEGEEGTQLITSGGGGAFLHSTLGPKVDEIVVPGPPTERYTLAAQYPDQATSKRLLLRNFLFPVWNPFFGFVTGAAYLAIGWLLRGPLAAATGVWWGRATLYYGLLGVLKSPGTLLLVLLTILAFVLFTETHSRWYRRIAGTAHGLTHLTAILFLTASATRLVGRTLAIDPDSVTGLLITGACVFAGGYALGSLIMGVYLYISLRIFGRHANEAFSALRIPDYKNFLRLHIGRDGALTVFPIGVDRVPRKWTSVPGASDTEPRYAPAEGQPLEPHLIEPPIVVR